MESDQAYRRGTILGLTIAEVFILLVFLLLLTLLLLTEQWKEERAEAADDKESLVQKNEALQRDLGREREEKEEIRQILFEWKDPSSIPAPEEVETLHDRVKNLQNQIDKTRKEKNEALQQNETLERELERERKDRRISEKGQDPPCWYEIRKNGEKKREKPHYLLNIAVFDEAMIIGRRPFPEGAATDDGGEPYAMEAQRLPLADIPYGEPLDDDTLRRYLEPIHDLGKEAKVRTYPCIFWISVWDETSEGAKTRWQHAHDRVLESLFGTYRFQDVPWPGG